MRELGFSQQCPKLKQDEFTTFRLARRDRDWQLGERVKVVHHTRRAREVLGVADIVGKEEVDLMGITDGEAITDGFPGWQEMANWLFKAYGERLTHVPLYKLILRHLI